MLGGQYNHEDPRNTVFVYNIASNQWRTMAQQPDKQMPSRHSAVGGTIKGKFYFITGSFSTTGFEGAFVTPTPTP